MGEFFGTDGFRGEANDKLTAYHAFVLGCFLAEYYKENSGDGVCRVAIGKDPRRSSYMLEYSLSAGLTACGANAYLLHVTTTPSVSYIVRSEGFDCGVMISASHNSFRDNGIKLLNGKGEKISDEVISLAEEYLKKPFCPAFSKGERIGRTVDYTEGRNRYIGYLISLSKCSYRGVKVGLDCANGSAFGIAQSVFNALGAQVYCINASPNGLNINENGGSTHPEVLARFVSEHGLDVGFAFDGDADRCICVDEKGKVVDGDGILYAAAVYLQSEGELDGNRIVTSVTANGGLSLALKKYGVSCESVAVGDRHVRERMRQIDCVLGGEPSGHIIYGKYATTGDGLLTAIKVMEMILESKKPLSELLKGYSPYPQVLVNVPVKDKSVALGAEIQSYAERLGMSTGIRVLLRPSGTENVVRIFCEGENAADCKIVSDLLRERVERADRKKEGRS